MFLSLAGLSIQDVCFELQVLASCMPQGLGLIWQGESVHEGVCGQLFLVEEVDLYRLVQSMD